MAFKKDDSVLITGKIVRKNPSTGEPETLNFSSEPGTVKRTHISEKFPEKNSYHVKTQYGVHMVHESKLSIATE